MSQKHDFCTCSPVCAEPECERDPDCKLIEYCEPRNQTCGDPCIRWPCGPYEYGIPVNHRCQCRCIDGYEIRNPDEGCGKLKETKNGLVKRSFLCPSKDNRRERVTYNLCLLTKMIMNGITQIGVACNPTACVLFNMDSLNGNGIILLNIRHCTVKFLRWLYNETT